MKRISPAYIIEVAPRITGPCLSIYANSPLELATVLGDAIAIAKRDLTQDETRRLFRPLVKFLRSKDFGNLEFPLAFFVTRGFAGHAKLPFSTKGLAVVASSFHVKPMLKWLQREHPFSLLLLKDREASIYSGNLSDFYRVVTFPYESFQTMDGVYRALDEAVGQVLRGRKVPLILAGKLAVIDVFRQISRQRSVVDEPILETTHDLENHHDLHRKALELIEPYLEKREQAWITQYRTAEKTGRTASQLREVVTLAVQGKVKHLFIDERMNIWGRIDPRTGIFTYSAAQEDAGDDDVLDDLAEIVLRRGGSVTVLPSKKMPNGHAACAILSPIDWQPLSSNTGERTQDLQASL